MSFPKTRSLTKAPLRRGLCFGHNSLAAGAGEVVTVFDGITTMQQMTSTICNNAQVGDTVKLLDTSEGGDGISYQVTKLKDNNCWMTENLNNSTGRVLPASVTSDSGQYQSSYGGYYNWENAIKVCAGIGNWELPSSNQYIALVGVYNIEDNEHGSTLLRNPPLNFVYGGYISEDSLDFAGSDAYYWTSTVDSSTNACYLYFTNSNVSPSLSNGVRQSSHSVRCIAR